MSGKIKNGAKKIVGIAIPCVSGAIAVKEKYGESKWDGDSSLKTAIKVSGTATYEGVKCIILNGLWNRISSE